MKLKKYFSKIKKIYSKHPDLLGALFLLIIQVIIITIEAFSYIVLKIDNKMFTEALLAFTIVILFIQMFIVAGKLIGSYTRFNR